MACKGGARAPGVLFGARALTHGGRGLVFGFGPGPCLGPGPGVLFGYNLVLAGIIIACQRNSSQGCYGFLRRLWRNNKNSRNKIMKELKNLIVSKKAGQTDEFPDLSDSSSNEVDESSGSCSPDVIIGKFDSTGRGTSTSSGSWITLLPRAPNQNIPTVHKLPGL